MPMLVPIPQLSPHFIQLVLLGFLKGFRKPLDTLTSFPLRMLHQEELKRHIWSSLCDTVVTSPVKKEGVINKFNLLLAKIQVLTFSLVLGKNNLYLGFKLSYLFGSKVPGQIG